ncbi:hypothetical protein [Belliella aquatica]|uniref:Uncharacterized protein n=1 Tax=Belliella aquatica TaxID=1323734 RepID=A0ABQ1MZC2_9BACT|nr:hypothetical protein [Belliella aquatica]MCH7403993.1 hypothetical protein [Belliella aquatica]GGC50014.1 hypothetical protein GCM10010993_30680 [Belliella aquatica]
MDFFKKHAKFGYGIAAFLVLTTIVIGYFIDFGDQIDALIRTIMFCLIGVDYLTFAWAFDKPALKLTFLSCGVYVIIMNFLPDFEIKSIIGIICIVIPFILIRILPDEEEPEHAE